MRRSRLLLGVSLLASMLVASSTLADVKLPAVIGDNMVLQQNTKVPIWGTAEPDEKVTVSIGGQKATATANAEGRWS